MSVSTSLELFKGSNQVLLTEIFLGVNMVPGIKGEVHSFELSWISTVLIGSIIIF